LRYRHPHPSGVVQQGMHGERHYQRAASGAEEYSADMGIDVSITEGVGFVSHRRFTDRVTTQTPRKDETPGFQTVQTVDPRLPLLGEIKASLCKGCKVEQAYTSGFHKGRCSACCPCPRHVGEREVMRSKGLWRAS